MAFDGIITKALVSDFQKSLIGARVNKVFQPSKTELILNLYNGENVMLDICIHPDYYRMCLTSLSKPNPTNALNFCMLLRKYLTSSKIINVQSVDLDRVVFIDFEGSNELKDTVNLRLVVELMGRRSNVVLLNKNGFIIDSLKHIITSDREILPAREYVLPLSSKQSFLDILNYDEFYSIISEKSYDDLSLYLSSIFTGFTPIFISNILEELNIENDSKDVNEKRLATRLVAYKTRLRTAVESYDDLGILSLETKDKPAATTAPIAAYFKIERFALRAFVAALEKNVSAESFTPFHSL